MVNNVIFTDLKKQEAIEKEEDKLDLENQSVLKFIRNRRLTQRRLSSITRRRQSMARRKSIDPLSIKVLSSQHHVLKRFLHLL